MNDHENPPEDNPNIIECPNCLGSGTIVIEEVIDEILEIDYEECSVCLGKGTLHKYYDRYVLRRVG